MRAFEFLIEYKQDITLKNYGDKLSQPEGKDASEVITAIEQMDPTKNNQYTEWLVRQYIKGQFKISDSDKVKATLEDFYKVKNNLEKDERDINRYKEFKELKSKIDKVYGSEEDEGPVSTNKYPVVPDSEVLYNGPLGQLSIPKTEAASCELGSGTKWCTASSEEGPNRFDVYNNQGPLYVWRDKSGKKYQFHFPTKQFMTAQDRPIDDDLLDKMKKHPVLKKYMFDVETKKLTTSPEAAYEHARSELEGRFPEGEAVIATSPEFSYQYARHVLKDRFPMGEPAILSEPSLIVPYAKNIIEGRWPEAEPYIAKDPQSAVKYARDVLYGRWPEAEAVIATNDEAAYYYALQVLEDRFPEGEPAIARNSNLATGYAHRIIGDRWPAAEPYIMKDTENAYWYATKVVNGRWPEAEPYIAKDPAVALKYFDELIHGRWPEAEDAIATDAGSSYHYANSVIDGPFPKGEDAIATDDFESLRYAKFVLKGPFPKGEWAIANGNSQIAVNYAKNVLGDPEPGTWAERYKQEHK